jgi:hypothetical protein
VGGKVFVAPAGIEPQQFLAGVPLLAVREVGAVKILRKL